YRKEETGTLIHIAFRPDFSTMSVDDSIDGRQPQPGSLELVVMMKALERREQLRRMADIKSNAVVPDHEHFLFGAMGQGNFDPRFFRFRGELPRIPQQVLHH